MGHAAPPAIFQTLKEGGYDGWVNIEGFGLGVPEIVDRLFLWRPLTPDG